MVIKFAKSKVLEAPLVAVLWSGAKTVIIVESQFQFIANQVSGHTYSSSYRYCKWVVAYLPIIGK